MGSPQMEPAHRGRKMDWSDDRPDFTIFFAMGVVLQKN